MDIWKIEEKNFKDREKTARKYTKNREANYRGYSNHSTYTTPRVDNYYKLRCMYIIAHVLFYWLLILLSYSTTYIILHTCPLFCCTHMSPIVLYPNVPVPICPSINMFWYPYVLLPIFPVPKWPSTHQSKYRYLLVCIWPTTKFPSATSSTSHRLHPYKREIIVSFRWNTSQATTSLLIKA